MSAQAHALLPHTVEPHPITELYSGKLGMMIEGEWQPNFIRDAGVNLDYGVAAPPHPAANPERKGTVSVAGTIMAIPAGVKNPDLSAKALAFLQGPKPLADFMVNNKNLPTTQAAAADPRFREDAKFAVFMDLLAGPNAKSHTLTPINSEVNAAIGAWYYLRIVGAMYLRTPLNPPPRKFALPGLAALWICAALTLGLGVSLGADYLQSAARQAFGLPPLSERRG